MSPYVGVAIGLIVVSLGGGIYAKGRADERLVLTAKFTAKIEAQRADMERKNATIVKGDQALIVAKAEDKEKIQIIYRTIREQVAAKIIEKPVYRDVACAVPADGLRLIAAAAAGGLPTDSAGSKDNPPRSPAGPKK